MLRVLQKLLKLSLKGVGMAGIHNLQIKTLRPKELKQIGKYYVANKLHVERGLP